MLATIFFAFSTESLSRSYSRRQSGLSFMSSSMRRPALPRATFRSTRSLMSISIFIFMSTDYRERWRSSTDFFKKKYPFRGLTLLFRLAENLVLTGLTHSANSELLFGKSVLESVGASTTDDARATRD